MPSVDSQSEKLCNGQSDSGELLFLSLFNAIHKFDTYPESIKDKLDKIESVEIRRGGSMSMCMRCEDGTKLVFARNEHRPAEWDIYTYKQPDGLQFVKKIYTVAYNEN